MLKHEYVLASECPHQAELNEAIIFEAYHKFLTVLRDVAGEDIIRHFPNAQEYH